MIKSNTTGQPKASDFEQYVKSQMTAADFEKLAEWLGVSSYRLTRIFNHPKRMYLEEIQRMAKILDMHECELIENYHVGYENISMEDMRKIRKGFNSRYNI